MLVRTVIVRIFRKSELFFPSTAERMISSSP